MNILLIGKTGHGKSATGNSILGRKEFKVSSNTKSVTTEVEVAWAERNPYNIQVVDGPGLMDTDLTHIEEKQKAIGDMAKVLSMCNGGVHAFILVIKFGTRFTKEERTTFSDLEDIYGPNYLKEHGIIVVTGGDNFQRVMELQETPNKSFREWWQEQGEDIFTNCPRIILFNNATENEEEKESQRNELLQIVDEISKEKGLYTSEHFKMYADVREQIIKQHNLPLLKENIQKNISLLVAELERISEKLMWADLEHLEIRIHVLNKEMEDLDQSEKSVKQLMCDLRTIQNTINKIKTSIKEGNTEDLQSHIENLHTQKEKLKRTKEIPWEVIAISVGAFLTVAGITLTGVGAFVTAPIVVLGAVSVISRALLAIGPLVFQYGYPYLRQKIDKWKNEK